MTRMKQTTLLAVLIALSLTGAVGTADPLHKYGNDGAWCHVDSGWIFPREVGAFARISSPYNIDGNNDAGAEYRQETQQLRAEVDVYAADSGAIDATLDGAKASAARKAGEAATAQLERPFQIAAQKDLSGVKLTYAPQAETSGARTNLYYFTTDRWRVKVLASTQIGGKNGDEALDAFVRALPWNTLGTESGIH